MDFLSVNNFGDTRSGGLAGPTGLFIIVLLSIATVLLIRNMNKRLRRLPDSFPQQPAAGGSGPKARSDADPAQPDTAPPSGDVDHGRSDASSPGAPTQVSDPDAEGRPGSVPSRSDGV